MNDDFDNAKDDKAMLERVHLKDGWCSFDYQRMVEEFHIAMGVPAPGEPTELPPERRELRAKLMFEELREFMEAASVRMWEGPNGLVTIVALNETAPSYHPPDEVEMADALVDLLYVTLGTAVEMGIDLYPLFHEVHRSNMNKLWEDGKPRMRPDGKVIKPPGWRPPNVKGLIIAQRKDKK